ncbi:MAG TPA: hypothetical protein GX734_02490 [Clostridiaceae bacterium]|nr:hypothetical protein [Clostridiaceae bacterium]
MKIRKYIALIIVCFLAMTLSISFVVMAATRRATISASRDKATVGQTFTVTLSFSPRAETRSFGFKLSYDSSTLQYVSGKNVSGLAGDFHEGGTGNQLNVGVTVSRTQSAVVGRAISLTFKAKAAGKATIKILEANDGIIDPEENTIIPGAPVSITITPAVPTTPKTTTPKTTTSKTTTTTKKTTSTTPKTTMTPKTTTPRTTTTTTSKSTKSSTTPTATTTITDTTTITETTPITTTETSSAATGPVIAFFAKRYDGALLNVPESVPADENIPISFSAEEINDYETPMTIYRSSTLPYKLFWLSDEGGEARFYYCDEETSLYVPYFRTEWSSRYFTFSIVPNDRLPQGFELKTYDIRGVKVPAYLPAKGYYVTHDAYYDLMSKVDSDTRVPDWRVYEGEVPESTGDSNDPTSTNPSGEDDRLTWQGVSVEIPDELLLVALRMNDSEKKMLYFYDRTLDSLIRADLWLVPLARTFLDYHEPIASYQPTTTPTELLTSTTTPSTSELVTGASEKKTLTFLGLTIPTWVPGAAIAVLVILLLLLIRGIVRAKKAKKLEQDFSLDDESFDGNDERHEQVDWSLLNEEIADDDLVWEQKSWAQLGIVDMIDQSTRSEDPMDLNKEESPDDLDDHEQIVDDKLTTMRGETLADGQEVVTTVTNVLPPTRTLESEWADLQRAVELSSARRQRRMVAPERLGDVEASDEDTTESEDVTQDDTEVEVVAETGRTIIQPGMKGNRPMRRIPLKRLQGIESTRPIDDALDEDEL